MIGALLLLLLLQDSSILENSPLRMRERETKQNKKMYWWRGNF